MSTLAHDRNVDPLPGVVPGAVTADGGGEPAPRGVRTAVTLLVVAAAVELVLAVVGASAPLWDRAWTAGSLTVEQALPIMVAGLVVGALGRLLVVAALVTMALAVRAGHAWPRVLLLVLAAVGLLGLGIGVVGALLATSLPGSSGGAVLVVTLLAQLVVVGLEVAAAVLLMTDPAGRWLRARAAHRRIAASSPA